MAGVHCRTLIFCQLAVTYNIIRRKRNKIDMSVNKCLFKWSRLIFYLSYRKLGKSRIKIRETNSFVITLNESKWKMCINQF